MWCSYCSVDVAADSKGLVDDTILGWIHNRTDDPDKNPDSWHTVTGVRVRELSNLKGGRKFDWDHGTEPAPGEGIRAVRLDAPDARG